MFNDYQLLLLQKERERELARQWRNQALRREAKQTTRGAVERHHEQVLKQVVLRTLGIALMVVLLALALTGIARAQSLLVLTKCPAEAPIHLAQDN